ncbi:MAG: BMP family lipoprotein [Christensenellales bacterium]|jgi:basic membrane protein A
MKTLKKVLVVVMIMALVLQIFGCASAPEVTNPTETKKPNTEAPIENNDPGEDNKGAVAVVFATGGLGDKTYNDSLYNGVKAVCEELDLKFDYSEPMDAAEYEPLLRGYAETGIYDLIISLGYSQGSSVEAVASNFPDQNFMLIDAEIDVDNVACYSWRENELSYMAGVMGAYMTKTKVLGFIAAFDIYNCNMNAAGLTAGAQSVDPEIKVLIDYVGSWDDISGCKEMAIAMHEQGADIIYHAASTGGLGILEAGMEKGFFTVGWDGNVNPDAPDTNFASEIRLFPVAAEKAITAAINGDFEGGVVSLGASDDAIEIVNEGSNVKIPDEVWDAINAAKAGITDGSIVVPKTLDELNG